MNRLSFLTRTIVLCLFLTSCEKPSEKFAWYILVDETETQKVDIEIITDHILKQSKADSLNTFKGSLLVNISKMNEKYTNKVENLYLEEGGSIFTEITNDRIAKQMKFREHLLETLNATFQFSDEKRVSKLYQPICQSLNELASLPVDKKYCVIFSDMLENTNMCSFYQYRKHPHKLMLDKELLISVLSQQCALGDLSDVEILVIYEPTAAIDDLFQSSKTFWQSFLSQSGCQINFKANL